MQDESPDTSSSQRGAIGNEIFEQVERLMAEEGLSRTNAFARISEETGRRAGTVAANYYRVARQRGATLQQRGPRGPRGARRGPRRATAARRSGSGDVDAALSRAMDAIQELADVVRSQQREIDELKVKAELADQMRSLVAR